MTPKGYVTAPPISSGHVLHTRFLDSKLTQERLAAAMKVSRFSVNQIVNGRRAITAEMALRLAFATSTTPELWLNLQRDVDLYQARQKLASVFDELEVVRPPKPDAELFVQRSDH